MNIAINTRLLIKGKLDGLGWFTHEILSRLVKNNPHVTFHFIFDRPFDPDFIFGPNVVPHQIGPPARHPLLYIIWFQFSLKRLLKKIKPDVFLSPDGHLPLNIDIPTISVIHDINFYHFPQDFDVFGRNYYNYYFPKYAKQADHIITVSQYSKEDIVKSYKIANDKISVIYNGIKEYYYPSVNGDKEAAKMVYSSGNPYFIFVGTLIPRKNICGLLQSFELFKTKYELPHKLLIIGNKQWWTKEMEAALVSMKYAKDVIFQGHIEPAKLRQAYIGADALVYIPHFEGFGVPLVEAMKCGIPTIASQHTAIPEIGGDAPLYVNADEPEEVADAMQIFSEESEYANMHIESGLIQSNKYNWDESAKQIWQIILNVKK